MDGVYETGTSRCLTDLPGACLGRLSRIICVNCTRKFVPVETPFVNREIRTMKQLFAAMLSLTALFAAMSSADAGILKCRKSRHCDQCAPPAANHVYEHAHRSRDCDCCQPVLCADCRCHAVATACCGMSAGFGGAAQLGAIYGMSHLATPGRYTGYEGLPNMDGGGLNGRFPYHSYRRPWAHPGPQSVNVSIVW